MNWKYGIVIESSFFVTFLGTIPKHLSIYYFSLIKKGITLQLTQADVVRWDFLLVAMPKANLQNFQNANEWRSPVVPTDKKHNNKEI